ncbi:MAG: FAD/FMN-containing dehydrogenase/Fe-S oxidoreductase [Lentisphaeria bacterium]|jgi:FAD/FMN-containing dehydrogenase/Fe-S oxidoreductase
MIPRLKHLNPTQTHYLEFVEALKVQAFAGEIHIDYANRIVQATDNSIYQVLPQGVLYPKSTEDIVVLTTLANQVQFRDIVLSPRGGGTGTNAQSLTDGLLVDLSKHMNKVLEINAQERWVRVETGVVKDQLNAALKPHGLFFAPDLSTSNRATIGGMINTDASGQGSCLYGKTRDHVVELQTVLMSSGVINSRAIDEAEFEAISEQQDRSGLIHRLVDNIDKEHHDLIQKIFPPLNRCLTGYDLAHIRDTEQKFNLNNILCGSEGTLGFITEAKLKVLPIPKCSALVLVKYNKFNDSLRDAMTLMNANPTSIETIDSTVLNLAMNDFIWHQVEAFFDEGDDIHAQGINLVEFTADSEDELKACIVKLETILSEKLNAPEQKKSKLWSLGQNKENEESKENSADAAENAACVTRIGYSVAWGKDAVNKIWAMRKRAVGLLGNIQGEARPIPFVEDTAVPPEHLADYIIEFREILDAYNLHYGMFGHVDAGVLHVRPALDMKDPEQEKIAWEISDRVAELTHQYHGLLWGEHGKGVRSEYSPKFFGELYPQLQRIKAAFDPYNQLNPGKIATPDASLQLLKIDEVATRGQQDRTIAVEQWNEFNEAVYCNGNGACFSWNTQDAMCPSYKGTRDRVHSPKGRASLIREWLRMLEENKSEEAKPDAKRGFFGKLNTLPERWRSTREKRKGEYDFSHEVYDSMSTCLACKSCTGQCPIKVNVPEFRSQFLELYHTRYMRPLKDYLVGSLEFLLPYCAITPRIYNTVMGFYPVKLILDKFVGFVDGPKLSGISFKKLKIAVATEKNLEALSDELKAKTVVIVQDAFTSYFESQLVVDTVRLLEVLGFNPMLAPYAANGKPLHVHGFLKAFKSVANKNAKRLNRISERGIPLIGIDPSMTLTYQSEYKKVLGDALAPKVSLIQEWLIDTLEPANLPYSCSASFKVMPHCTEKTNATNSNTQWKNIFTMFGHECEILEVGCCGMAGTYGHESRNREMSSTIYELSWKKPVEDFAISGKLLATGYSCRSQIKRENRINILHPVQALLNALDREVNEKT